MQIIGLQTSTPATTAGGGSGRSIVLLIVLIVVSILVLILVVVGVLVEHLHQVDDVLRLAQLSLYGAGGGRVAQLRPLCTQRRDTSTGKQLLVRTRLLHT